jgi:hydroxyacylglutathione hydrolase
MQVGPHVYDVRMPFKLEIAAGRTVERFVYLWIICTKRIDLVDSGIAGAIKMISRNIEEMRRNSADIATLTITHAHPDHVGGAAGVKKATGCTVVAHQADRSWIEDTELQFRQRPVPGFHSIVEGSVKVDRLLRDGDTVELADGNSLRVIHTPGHARGHVSLLYESEKTLFCGDCIPVQGETPMYEDAVASVKSVKRLRDIGGLELLLSSWDTPRRGRQIYETMDQGMACIQNVHSAVRQVRSELDAADTPKLASAVAKKLGLPDVALNPLFFRTIEAHLRVVDFPDLSTL